MAAALRYRFNLDRRSGKDRRKLSQHSILKQFLSGHRAGARRHEDRTRIFFVDRYGTTLFLSIVAILFLSLIDALLTLLLIEHGAVEVNPLMAYYLKIGPQVFITVKYLLTSLSVFILAVFSHLIFSRVNIRVHSVLSLIVGAFLSVIAWQIYLITKIVL